MKRIFIYYSLTGNGDVVSEYLKSKKIDVRKVNSAKKLPQNMILRLLSGGFLAGINHRDKLIDFNSDINEYDEIIIGSPIWNRKLSCPINSVLDIVDLNNKKIVFILYSGSGKSVKTEKKLKKKYKNVSIISLKEPKKNNFKRVLDKEL